MMLKARGEQILQSGKFNGEDTVRKVWKLGDKISYQDVLDVSLMHTKAEFLRAE